MIRGVVVSSGRKKFNSPDFMYVDEDYLEKKSFFAVNEMRSLGIERAILTLHFSSDDIFDRIVLEAKKRTELDIEISKLELFTKSHEEENQQKVTIIADTQREAKALFLLLKKLLLENSADTVINKLNKEAQELFEEAIRKSKDITVASDIVGELKISSQKNGRYLLGDYLDVTITIVNKSETEAILKSINNAIPIYLKYIKSNYNLKELRSSLVFERGGILIQYERPVSLYLTFMTVKAGNYSYQPAIRIVDFDGYVYNPIPLQKYNILIEENNSIK